MSFSLQLLKAQELYSPLYLPFVLARDSWPEVLNLSAIIEILNNSMVTGTAHSPLEFIVPENMEANLSGFYNLSQASGSGAPAR